MYGWVSDPEIAVAIGLRRSPTLEYTRQWIQRSIENPLINAYALLFNNLHVGTAVLDNTDTYLRTSRLSVYIGERSARGTGVGLTGIYYVLVDGFKKHDLHKIWLTVHVNNQAALKTYTTLNFKVEGVLRDEFLIHSRRTDVYYMGLLRDEFEQLSTAV
jgi:RimJ/RimL family protein N-acetyltransferase